MDNVSSIESQLNKLGCANATNRSESMSKASEKGNYIKIETYFR